MREGLGHACRTGKRGMAWWAARGQAGGQSRNMPAGLRIACVASAFRPASLDFLVHFRSGMPRGWAVGCF